VAGLGDLDVCNGRLCVTPEYPQGTCYFATLDRQGNSAPPYLLGPTYCSVLKNSNLFVMVLPAATPTTQVMVNEPT